MHINKLIALFIVKIKTLKNEFFAINLFFNLDYKLKIILFYISLKYSSYIKTIEKLSIIFFSDVILVLI